MILGGYTEALLELAASRNACLTRAEACRPGLVEPSRRVGARAAADSASHASQSPPRSQPTDSPEARAEAARRCGSRWLHRHEPNGSSRLRSRRRTAPECIRARPPPLSRAWAAPGRGRRSRALRCRRPGCRHVIQESERGLLVLGTDVHQHGRRIVPRKLDLIPGPSLDDLHEGPERVAAGSDRRATGPPHPRSLRRSDRSETRPDEAASRRPRRAPAAGRPDRVDDRGDGRAGIGRTASCASTPTISARTSRAATTST